jgi:hypothetical protein
MANNSKELAEMMISRLCLDNNAIRSSIDELDVDELEKELTFAMDCNWTEENITTFVCGETKESDLIADIIPNGKIIDAVLDKIFTKLP